ncbi:hypothetical protein [Nocardia brevicatena]|nr:hypothetical protein [Nocardia brevicatena]
MDNANGKAWWQYDAVEESVEDAERKQVTPRRFDELVDSLTDWKLI